MRIFVLLLVTAACFSCKSKPYVNHTLKATKAGNCTNEQLATKITSNFRGEMYEFQECLPADFDGKDYTAERKGDTLQVQFPGAKTNGQKALFTLVLEIDAYPKYHFIQLGDELIPINIASN